MHFPNTLFFIFEIIVSLKFEMSIFYVISVDCGSDSVRSCIVEYSNKGPNNGSVGRFLITRKKDIPILHPKPGVCANLKVFNFLFLIFQF